MSQASQDITQQFVNGGVVPNTLVGQNAASTTYVDAQDAIRDVNIAVVASTANNAQSEIDSLEVRVNDIITGAGDSNIEIVDARGGYTVLKDRLDSSDAQLMDIEKEVPRGFNVVGYGADPTGVIDSTVPILATIDACILSGGGVIYFPAGIFLISEKIVKNLTVSLSLKGVGQELTKLRWVNADGGMDFVLNGKKVIVSDITLETMVMDGGTAFNARNVNGLFRVGAVGVEMINVFISGYADDTQWTTHISLYDVSQSLLSNIYTKGASLIKTSSHIVIDGIYDPVENYIINWRALWYGVGLEVKGNTEGVYLSKQALVSGRVGIKWDTPGVEPLLSISGGHISALEYGIYGKNLADSFISDVLIYEDGGYDPSITSFTAIHLENSQHTKVSNNTIRTYGTGRIEKGVVCVNSRNVIIARNTFVSGVVTPFSDYCIDIDTLSSNCRCVENEFDNVLKEINLLSASSSVVSLFKRMATYSLGLFRSTISNTDYEVEWTTIDYATDNFLNLGIKSEVIIPSNKGIRKVKLTSTIKWEENSIGLREIAITKNGGSASGLSYVQYTPQGSAYMTINTGVVLCADGDVFKVRVKQTSGVDLYLSAGNDIFVQIEVVE